MINQMNPVFDISLKDERAIINDLLPEIKFSNVRQKSIMDSAKKLASIVRNNKDFGIEEFIQQFSLSTEEGVAIMCLAEGLLRIPDQKTASELLIDKLSNKSWQSYLSKSKSIKAYFIACGLCVSGKFADIFDIQNILTKLISKVGQPVFLIILKKAIELLGQEFVFGSDIESAVSNTKIYPKYRFAFDLLGESARTSEQAEYYYNQYIYAIDYIGAELASEGEVNQKPNLSVKLTALFPRFEFAKKSDIDNYLLPKLILLVKKIRDNNLTITFDAEEAFRLDIYLYTLFQILNHQELQGFSGIGFVIQAYQTRAYEVLDLVIGIAKSQKRQIPVRLVKGAYWDLEIKNAQDQGLEYYPVFTKKEHTDASYVACAKKMLENDQYIFSQFATHNALTAATIIELAQNKIFEFQKLHGMGKMLHDKLVKDYPVRVYAPVGKMNDLLAYLMRRMLENGANACFVNQVKNSSIPLEKLVYNLHDKIKESCESDNWLILPKDIYPHRENPVGYNLGYKMDYDKIQEKVSSFYVKTAHQVGSIISGDIIKTAIQKERFCPAKKDKKFADIFVANDDDIIKTVKIADDAFKIWSKYTVKQRADIIRKIADLYEDNKFYLYALLIQEAGKTIKDAIAEVVEAIDFCRYYANQVEAIFEPRILPSPTGESNVLTLNPRGIFLCISPWNFPLAIFTGQIVAALVCGNTVIAKSAEQTPVIAFTAIRLMHKAGVPVVALNLLIAPGSAISKYLISDERVSGVVFTGSTETARLINLTLAVRTNGIVPFIAETGGQNTMIVDSSALLEQVTDDVINSAFGSAGQRCSALRVLYIQEEIFTPLLDMIKGAMSLLKIADSSDFSADVGAVIDSNAVLSLTRHVEDMQSKGFKLLARHPQFGKLNDGCFFVPHIIEINSINDVPDEKFGPILHVISYNSDELDRILEEINNCGFGLTFGIHSRIETKVKDVCSKMRIGNIYANRSIIGAKVESQPFGGENKSGTGFKAGGPNYLLKFITERTITINLTAIGGNVELLK